jgi:peroxiredoxin
MSVTPSTMLSLGTEAPYFKLPGINGNLVSLDDFKDAKALLVVFMCNHCPYVKHIIRDFVQLAEEYQDKEVGIVGINSNDISTYPEDAPEKMKEVSKELGFSFPYLYDETQEVAKAYQAACTPDFFLFGRDRKLVYRGQMDDSRPGNHKPITGKDLRHAINAVLKDLPVSPEQKPSMGCNIKWKSGKEPDWK